MGERLEGRVDAFRATRIVPNGGVHQVASDETDQEAAAEVTEGAEGFDRPSPDGGPKLFEREVLAMSCAKPQIASAAPPTMRQAPRKPSNAPCPLA